jgi:hypothetical protein
MSNLEIAMAAVQRAQEADDLFWNSERNSTPHRRRRNQAVVEALAAGLPAARLADELGVTVADVDRMAKDCTSL